MTEMENNTQAAETPTAPEEKKETTLEDLVVKVYKPTKLNQNYHGEWAFAYGALVYGMSLRKRDNKLMITYNVDAHGLSTEHFEEISVNEVPKKVYELFVQKMHADISRMDSMMNNIVKNKALLNQLIGFVETNHADGSDEMQEALAYTEEDAKKDQQIEAMQTMNQQRLQRGPSRKRGVTKKRSKRRK